MQAGNSPSREQSRQILHKSLERDHCVPSLQPTNKQARTNSLNLIANFRRFNYICDLETHILNTSLYKILNKLWHPENLEDEDRFDKVSV